MEEYYVHDVCMNLMHTLKNDEAGIYKHCSIIVLKILIKTFTCSSSFISINRSHKGICACHFHATRTWNQCMISQENKDINHV